MTKRRWQQRTTQKENLEDIQAMKKEMIENFMEKQHTHTHTNSRNSLINNKMKKIAEIQQQKNQVLNNYPLKPTQHIFHIFLYFFYCVSIALSLVAL